MIMPRGQMLLMPVRPAYIVASLVAALAVNMLPLGQVPWMPDILMVVLAFWGLHQPLRVGMGTAFALGLCMDVQQSALLGQHALTYAVLLYGVTQGQRRLTWHGAISQVPLMLGIFASAQVVAVVVGVVGRSTLPTVGAAVAPCLEALIWAPVSWLLLAPQRRPPDRTEKRS